MKKRVVAILLLMFVTLFSYLISIKAQTAVTGSFSFGNTAPDNPSNIQLQEADEGCGGNAYDTWTTDPSLDTHMLNATLRWGESDTNNDNVFTYVCLTTNSSKISELTNDTQKNNTICDVINYWNTTTTDDIHAINDNTTGIRLSINSTGPQTIAYNSTARKYYGALLAYDNKTYPNMSSIVEFNFTINNSIPTAPSNINISAIHLVNPDFNWTPSADTDDGSGADKCPADSINYTITIGDAASGDTERLVLLYNRTSNLYDWDGNATNLTWGTTQSGNWANKTYYFRINATDGHNNSYSGSYEGSFVLYNYLINVTSVELSDNVTDYVSCTTSTCTLAPVKGTNISLAVRINATDTDGDCDVSDVVNATLNICFNSSVWGDCDDSSYNFTYAVDSVTRTGTSCTIEFSTNKSASDGTPQFFRTAGTYIYNVNVTDQSKVLRNDSPNINGSWGYSGLSAVNYTTAVTLGDGSIDMNKWNNGTTGYNMTNFGNQVLYVKWNSTNPTGPGTWTLNGSDFALDDEADQLVDSGGNDIALIYLNNTPQKGFNYTSGLQVCLDAECGDLNTNESMPTHFHIAPPTLPAGTYTNTIWYTLSTS